MQVRNRICDQFHWGMKSSTTSKVGNVLKDRLSRFRRVGEPRATRQTSKSTIETEMTKRRASLAVEGGQEIHLSESFHGQNGLLKRIIQTGGSSRRGRQMNFTRWKPSDMTSIPNSDGPASYRNTGRGTSSNHLRKHVPCLGGNPIKRSPLAKFGD